MAQFHSRISESVNALTADIDVTPPVGIVRLLRQSDAQMFAGFGGWEGVFDDGVLNVLTEVRGAPHAPAGPLTPTALPMPL
jgi:hypothetical protein